MGNKGTVKRAGARTGAATNRFCSSCSSIARTEITPSRHRSAREIQKHIEDLRIAPAPEIGERVVRVTGRAKVDGPLTFDFRLNY